MDARLEAIEAHKKAIADEIAAAHNSDAKGVEDPTTHEITPATYGSLDARFEGTEIDVKNINAKIGGNFDSTNTVAAAITIAESTAISTAEGYTDTKNTYYNVSEINDAHRTGLVNDQNQPIIDTLDNRFDNIEDRLDAIDTPNTGSIAGLDSRIDTLETAVTA